MTFIDLTEHLEPDLVFPWKDRVFKVPPPSHEAGLLMTAAHAKGVAIHAEAVGPCEVCGRSGEVKTTERVDALAAQANEMETSELSLGPARQEMIDAGVPAPDIDLFAFYAYWYWVAGKSGADAMLAARKGAVNGQTAPKAPPPSKTTRNTASASRSAKTKTATRSTPTTASRKK